MNNNWTREHPIPPIKGLDSEWYWFYKDTESQPRVAEVWPERKWWSPGWWGPQVPKPIIPKDISNEQETQKNSEDKDKEKNKSLHDATFYEDDKRPNPKHERTRRTKSS